MPQTTQMSKAFGIIFYFCVILYIYDWIQMFYLILGVLKSYANKQDLVTYEWQQDHCPSYLFLLSTGKIKRAESYQIQAYKAQRGMIKSAYHLCDILPLQKQCLSVERRWNIISINSKYFKHWSSMQLNFGILLKIAPCRQTMNNSFTYKSTHACFSNRGLM